MEPIEILRESVSHRHDNLDVVYVVLRVSG